MRQKKLALICFLVALVTASCTGMSFLSGAKGEFDAGINFFNRGVYDQAVPHFLKATELDPEFDKAYLYLGRSYLSLGRWSDAVQPLRTAYRLAPAETQKEIGSILFDALLSAAVGELKQGQFMPAIEHLREGLALDPSSSQAKSELAGAFVGYGGALLRDGRVADAISAFQDALGVAPGSLDAYLGLAQAFMRKGEPSKAKEAADSATRIAPGSRSLNDMLERIGTPH